MTWKNEVVGMLRLFCIILEFAARRARNKDAKIYWQGLRDELEDMLLDVEQS